MIRRWREIERWIEDEEGAHQTSFAEHPLSDFITRKVVAINRTAVPLEQLNVIAKISFGGDLHIRTSEGKRGYKGPLFHAHPGDLVISKIRVAQGSLCIVPDELEHLAVSAEYPVYSINSEQVSGDFIRLVIRSSAFKQRISRLRSGNTTKARIRPAQFEELKVPLPSLTEQRAFVDAYGDARSRAAVLEQEANAIEQACVLAFESALGVASSPPLPDRPVFIARFKAFERWSHDGILRAAGQPDTASAKWKMSPLGDALLEVRHGCSVGPSKSKTALRVLKISSVTKGQLDLSEHKYIADSPQLRDQFSLLRGDILMCRTNGTLAYVGMSALVEDDIADAIFPDKVIRVRPDTSKIDPAFLWRLLQLPALRRQIEGAARTAVGNYAIGGKDIKLLNVPLPPVGDQASLVAALNAARSRARAKRAEAKALREFAWTTFESSLFDSQA